MDSLSFPAILIIAIGMSTDCFAVALSGSISLGSSSFIQVLRTALSFGFFQAMMPVLGWLAGRTVVGLISVYDHWLAFGLLLLVGSRMLWASRRSGEDGGVSSDITKGWLLLTLSVATSIDALAVGLSFAFMQVNIVLASATIGAVTFLVTIIGFRLGKKAGKIIRKRAEVVGGLILIAIGLKILLTDLL